MHGNANREFTAEYTSEFAPADVTRSIVHGRLFTGTQWSVVHTTLRTGSDGRDWIGSTLIGPIDGESLTWGGERIVIEKLPIVTHEGVRDDAPGWFGTGSAAGVENGKTHLTWYALGRDMCVNTKAPALCGPSDLWGRGSADASWLMDDKGVCGHCKRRARVVLAAL